MTQNAKNAPKVGLVELPSIELIDGEGNDWNKSSTGRELISKQILVPQIGAGGFDAQLINLKAGNHVEIYGEVPWKGGKLIKTTRGGKYTELDPEACDAWGMTVNFTVERELACMIVRHLVGKGKPVVVGGSDALAEPQHYFDAGASAVVYDKSGAANWAILDHLLGRPEREKLSGVIFPDGRKIPRRKPPMNPDDWPLPSPRLVKQCLGEGYVLTNLKKKLYPVGSIFPDIGCDRKCDFCQTPTYATGYRKMSVERTLQWAALQKQAGARSITISSDQFLGRVLWPGGREEVLAIMKGLREMDMVFHFPNGLELRKATLGRGFNKAGTDLTPDHELINALWGWDGDVGCYHAFIPAERPMSGRTDYAKLLPWQEHCDLMRAVVRTGVACLSYAIIVGFPDESDESLLRLEEAIQKLYLELSGINPAMEFSVIALSISPLPGTWQGKNLHDKGLVRFSDPAIIGGFQTACADTNHLSYEQISDWQLRLCKIGYGIPWFRRKLA